MSRKSKNCLILVILFMFAIFGSTREKVKADELVMPDDLVYTVNPDNGHVSCKFTALSGDVMYSLMVSDTENGEYSAVDYVQYCYVGDTYTLTNEYTIDGEVKWYRMQVWSSFRDPIYSAPQMVTGLIPTPEILASECVAYGNCAKLVWDDVNFSEKYYVYRAIKKNGTYKKIAETQNTFYYDSSVKSKKTYYYKVTSVSEQLVESDKSAAMRLKTSATPSGYSKKCIIPDFASYSGIEGTSEKNVFGNTVQFKITYTGVSNEMYTGYSKLLLQKKYQLSSLGCTDTVACFDYIGKKKIARGVSAFGEGAEYRTIADVYLSYSLSQEKMTIYLSSSFTKTAVGKNEKYITSDETANRDNVDASKKKKNCTYCLGTGKVKCQKCHGTGKVTKNVYNSRTHIYDTISVACPMCVNGLESCTYCGGRGWN